MANSCSIDLCMRDAVARQLCHKHYKRLQRHGDPLRVEASPLGQFSDKEFAAKHRYRFPTKYSGSNAGIRATGAYMSWRCMKTRCLNKNAENYKRYGGLGVQICDEWVDFAGFYKSMGDRPKGTTLDRVDPSGNYEPSNCRWASATVQANNRRRTNKKLSV